MSVQVSTCSIRTQRISFSGPGSNDKDPCFDMNSTIIHSQWLLLPLTPHQIGNNTFSKNRHIDRIKVSCNVKYFLLSHDIISFPLCSSQSHIHEGVFVPFEISSFDHNSNLMINVHFSHFINHNCEMFRHFVSVFYDKGNKSTILDFGILTSVCPSI